MATWLCGLLLVLAARPLLAEPGDEPSLGFALEVSVRWVLVPVVVESRRGYVDRLEADDFDLRVDERPVEIESFESGASGPFSLAILQDLSGSMATVDRLEHSKRVVRCILDQTRPGDELGLASFASGRTVVEVPLTSEHDVLREAMELWDPRGTTALHDAVAWLPELRRGASNPKSGALLLTDGVDNASEIAPDVARRIVAGAELPVYVVAFQGRERRIEPARSLVYASILRTLASATTGSYHRIGEAADLDRACREIVADLRHQYVLGFRTRGDGPEQRRSIRVLVESEEHRVAFRESYYGPAPL